MRAIVTPFIHPLTGEPKVEIQIIPENREDHEVLQQVANNGVGRGDLCAFLSHPHFWGLFSGLQIELEQPKGREGKQR